MKLSAIGDRVPVVIIHIFASRYSPNFEEEEAQASGHCICSCIRGASSVYKLDMFSSLAIFFLASVSTVL